MDTAHYMGPTTSMTNILQQLTIIFDTMAFFDVLMWNFYKVTQGNHEKVPSFATRLEGTLNQIRLQCPGTVTDLEVKQQLRYCLFHRVCKHIRDSIRYLYSNPRTTYSQLMIAAHKAQSENEEACNEVRARSAMTTDPVVVTTELGDQIAKLMATLTRAGQGNSPTSTPNSPRHRSNGWDAYTGALLAAPTSKMAELVWDRLPWSTAHLPAMAQGGITTHSDQRQNGQGAKDRQEATANRRAPVLSSALGTKVGAIWLRNVPPQPNFKPVWGELRECGPASCHHQQQQPTVDPQHSLPDPKPN